MNWTDLVNQFHFIRPEYLFALPALALIWLALGKLQGSTHWEQFIAQDKLEALRVTGGRYSQAWRWLLLCGWLLGTLAAAGPTWKQIPVPTHRDESAMVIVLDLSRSMLALDITPDRLTRTKYKIIDILRQRGDGQTALVAYAGDPHTVSPLTDDPGTIEALLPALHPNIMPVQGSNTEAAIELALQLLRDAGAQNGDILLLTDGVAPEAQRYIRNLIDGSFRLSVLGIGSVDAVPIPREGGGFFTDSRGEIILTKLNRDELQILAGLTAGRYVEIQSDDSDIQYLLLDQFEAKPDNEENLSALYDSWEDMGYWLVLLILPLAALSFRKGAIYALPLFFFMPNDSQAFEWADLWKTPDQQGAALLQQKNPQDAAPLFERADWAGTAEYQLGNYDSAAEYFSENDDLVSQYNRGNALAFQGDLEGALAAYETVLQTQPDHADAAHNKSVIEQLLQQQEQQQEQQQNQEGDQSDQQSGEDGEQSESESQQGQQSQDQQSQDQEGQNQEGQNQESQNQNGEQQDSSDQPSGDQQAQQNQEQSDSQPSSEETQQSQPAQESEQQQEQSEQNAQASQQEEAAESEPSDEQQISMMPAEATPDQLEDSSEQWLRAIPDDPSGLLRRKFDFESRQNQLEQRYRLQIPTNPDDERY